MRLRTIATTSLACVATALAATTFVAAPAQAAGPRTATATVQGSNMNGCKAALSARIASLQSQGKGIAGTIPCAYSGGSGSAAYKGYVTYYVNIGR